MAPRNVSYSQQITKFLECTFESHQDLMFHRVVWESRYRFVVGLFDHCEPFHRHLQQLLGLKSPTELPGCHCLTLCRGNYSTTIKWTAKSTYLDLHVAKGTRKGLGRVLGNMGLRLQRQFLAGTYSYSGTILSQHLSWPSWWNFPR